MKKLILCLCLSFTVALLAAQNAPDTIRPKPDDLVMLRVAQVEFILKKMERLQEDLNDLKMTLFNIANAGWVKPQASTQLNQPPILKEGPPKKEGPKQ